MNVNDAARLTVGTPILCPPGWSNSESGVAISSGAFGRVVEVHESDETCQVIAVTIRWNQKHANQTLTTHGVSSQAMKSLAIYTPISELTP